MSCDRDRSYGVPAARQLRKRLRALMLESGAIALLLAGATPAAASAQASSAASVVFDGVTVVDVEHGRLVPNQRVVIAGNRIQTVGLVNSVTIPQGAQTVDARGKYLIPGLWDMHHHTGTSLVYLLLVANGVTGMRDAGSDIPLDTFARWRREILAGTRVGPPRQILSGRFIEEGCQGLTKHGVCIAKGDTGAARRTVDSLQAAGADMIKIHNVTAEVYFAIAAAARHAGIPFGGHHGQAAAEPVTTVSDSGASILDHSDALGEPCSPASGTIEECRKVAERFRHNGTWWVPTCIGFIVCGGPRAAAVGERFGELTQNFVTFSVLNPYAPDGTGRNALQDAMPDGSLPDTNTGWPDLLMHLQQEAGIPILAGTDVLGYWPSPQVTGFALHAELAMDVAEGLTPLTALQSATLNPAKFLHATDSLGTVAPGKLADLVLLDADPLADITNTTTIRAVVANGRYFDRAALDQLLATFQAQAKSLPVP